MNLPSWLQFKKKKNRETPEEFKRKIMILGDENLALLKAKYESLLERQKLANIPLMTVAIMTPLIVVIVNYSFDHTNSTIRTLLLFGVLALLLQFVLARYMRSSMDSVEICKLRLVIIDTEIETREKKADEAGKANLEKMRKFKRKIKNPNNSLTTHVSIQFTTQPLERTLSTRSKVKYRQVKRFPQ